MILCIFGLHGRCTEKRYPDPVRVPALYVYSEVEDARYMLHHDDTDGSVYICRQVVGGYHAFQAEPHIYCVRGDPLVRVNPQYVPYEARCWFDNEHHIAICLHHDGRLSGYTHVRATQHKPAGDVIFLGETQNAYIIKDNEGDVV